MTRINMKWATTGLSTDAADIDNAIRWCNDRFGSWANGNPKWNYVGLGEFEFLDEQDAIFFMLRWL